MRGTFYVKANFFFLLFIKPFRLILLGFCSTKLFTSLIATIDSGELDGILCISDRIERVFELFKK